MTAPNRDKPNIKPNTTNSSIYNLKAAMPSCEAKSDWPRWNYDLIYNNRCIQHPIHMDVDLTSSFFSFHF